MPDAMDAERVAGLIARNTPDADRQLAEAMQRPDAGAVIERLLGWPDAAVRFWALGAAKRVLPRSEFINALKRATRDRDEVVRTEAVAGLVDLKPAYLSKSIATLAAELRSDIPPGEKVFVLWTLAKLKAGRAAPRIESLRASEPAWTQLARVADVVLTYLKEGPQPALRRIANHSDHARMEELCTLAWHVIGTSEAREALDACAVNAPDEACRKACSSALRQWDSDT